MKKVNFKVNGMDKQVVTDSNLLLVDILRDWRVVRFLRDFYSYQRRAPLNNLIKKGTGISLQELESLFPGGIKYGARRLAGLPNPKACTGI
jgi:sulfur relay (sulfurtransferase) DsrC/TusE family protein